MNRYVIPMTIWGAGMAHSLTAIVAPSRRVWQVGGFLLLGVIVIASAFRMMT